MITGEQIRRIRQNFGWTIEQFARVLGVHPVTLNRWELCEQKVAPADGMPGAILLGLHRRMTQPNATARRQAKAEAEQKAAEIEQLLVVGGVLVALAALLTFINRVK